MCAASPALCAGFRADDSEIVFLPLIGLCSLLLLLLPHLLLPLALCSAPRDSLLLLLAPHKDSILHLPQFLLEIASELGRSATLGAQIAPSLTA